MNRLAIRIFTASLFFTSLETLAAAPTLVATIQTSTPSMVGRASSDGKRLVVQLQSSGQRHSSLQVIDTSDFQHPKLMGFLALPKNGDMALSSDGQLALVAIETEEKKYNEETGELVIAIDLTDPANPRELWREKLMARKIILSADANAFAFSRHSATNPRLWETIVVSATNTQSRIAVAEDDYSEANMLLSPHATFLAYTTFGQIFVWDLRSTTPIRFDQTFVNFDRYGCTSAVLDSGHVIIQDSRVDRFGIYEPVSGIPRIATLPHENTEHCQSLNPNTPDNVFMFSDSYDQLKQLDIHTPNNPTTGRVWTRPHDVFPIASAQNLLFAGKQNAPQIQVYRLDIESPVTLDWQALDRDHKSIIKTYQAMLKTKNAMPLYPAIEGLEKAGVFQAIEAPLVTISPEKAAEILNDYAFLVAKTSTTSALVENALRRAITMDPRRKVAHLNLADFLRKGFALYVSTGGMANARRKEIEDHYRRYLSLGGKPTPIITAYLKDDQTETDACTLIADYTNAGRLEELVSDVGTNIPFKDKKIDLIFTAKGSASVPYYYAFDSINDFPLFDSVDEPAQSKYQRPQGSPNSEDIGGGVYLGLLVYRNQYSIFHYMDLQFPIASWSLAHKSACQFKVTVQEQIGAKATKPDLCAKLIKNQGPSPLKFDGTSLIAREEVSRIWWESSIVGTRLLDFANNGKPVNIAELKMASGAGRGCDESFYDTLSLDATQFDSGQNRDLLMQLQDAAPAERYPVSCGNSPRFFFYENRIYFETKPSVWPPEAQGDVYHQVTTISDGQVQNVCDFKFNSSISGRRND